MNVAMQYQELFLRGLSGKQLLTANCPYDK
jgi:hypothetical protein